MKVYIIIRAYEMHNTGREENIVKVYTNKDKAFAHFNTLKESIKNEFYKDYGNRDSEINEEITDTSYLIERDGYYDWESVDLYIEDAEE